MSIVENDPLRRSRERVRDLLAVASEARKVLIITHDNPDPDALASSVALRYLLRKSAKRDSVIAFGGSIGRPENRALARSLRTPLRPAREIDFRSYRVIAMVDSQPRTGNNSLPREIQPSIVIDHHQARKATWASRFTDVRTDHGATSTILTEYLQTLGVPITQSLATALFYGIKSDTRNLERSRNDADSRAFTFLFPMVGQAQLNAIEHARVSRHHFQMMKAVIENAVIYGNVVVSRLGRVESPDDVAGSSDELIRLESMHWAAALGLHNGDICISLRNGGRAGDAARILRRVVGRSGSAGGHGAMAGARIPTKRPGNDLTPDEMMQRYADRLVDVLTGRGRGAKGPKEGKSLVPGEPVAESLAETPAPAPAGAARATAGKNEGN